MLSRKIEEELLRRLGSGKYAPGEELPSIRAMCREFGCSYVIACRVVQKLKQLGCVETVKGNGTYVTRDFQRCLRKRLLIYVFGEERCDSLTPGNVVRYTTFQRMARQSSHMDLALRENEQLSAGELDNLAGALITLNSVMMDELAARRIPCVFISSLDNPYGMPTVTPDFYQGSMLVMRHLIAAGARRIQALTIDGAAYNQGSYLPRLQAYRDAVEEAGLPVRPPLPWNIRNPENRSWLRALMRSPDAPDAFYASNDKLAVELIHELNLLGLSVPGEVKVAGLENMDYLYDPLHPLTTAAYDNELLARTACELLRQMIDNPGERPASVKIPMTLIKRVSTLSAACA